MKLSYEERLSGGARSDKKGDGRLPIWKRALEGLGWRKKTFSLTMPAVALASSFHVEIPAPPDMEIVVARLSPRVLPDRSGSSKPPEDATDDSLVQRAHLYASNWHEEYIADAQIYLRAKRPGFLRAAMLTGWLATALLAGGYAFLSDITSSANSQTAGALLLVVPTFFAGALIRPDEHRLVSAALLGVRVLLAITLLTLLVAVGLLTGAASDVRESIWLGALGFAGVAAVALSVSYVLPRPPRE